MSIKEPRSSSAFLPGQYPGSVIMLWTACLVLLVGLVTCWPARPLRDWDRWMQEAKGNGQLDLKKAGNDARELGRSSTFREAANKQAVKDKHETAQHEGNSVPGDILKNHIAIFLNLCDAACSDKMSITICYSVKKVAKHRTTLDWEKRRRYYLCWVYLKFNVEIHIKPNARI